MDQAVFHIERFGKYQQDANNAGGQPVKGKKKAGSESLV